MKFIGEAKGDASWRLFKLWNDWLGYALCFCDSSVNVLSRARYTLDLTLSCSKTEDDLLRPQSLLIVIKWSCVYAIVRLVVQRTKLIDETQEILLELLEEMTTGTMVM